VSGRFCDRSLALQSRAFLNIARANAKRSALESQATLEVLNLCRQIRSNPSGRKNPSVRHVRYKFASISIRPKHPILSGDGCGSQMEETESQRGRQTLAGPRMKKVVAPRGPPSARTRLPNSMAVNEPQKADDVAYQREPGSVSRTRGQSAPRPRQAPQAARLAPSCEATDKTGNRAVGKVFRAAGTRGLRSARS